MPIETFKDITIYNKRYADFITQRNIMSVDFPFVKCCNFSKASNVLHFKFTLSDKDWKYKYSFVIKYIFTLRPGYDFHSNSTLTSLEYPFIEPNPDIHLLPQQILCLSFPSEFSHYRKIIISRDIVPKCIDWVNNYELWKINGNKWVGNQRYHGEHKDMEVYYSKLTGKQDLFD